MTDYRPRDFPHNKGAPPQAASAPPDCTHTEPYHYCPECPAMAASASTAIEKGLGACPDSRAILGVKTHERSTENGNRIVGEEKRGGPDRPRSDAIRTGGTESGALGRDLPQHEVGEPEPAEKAGEQGALTGHDGKRWPETMDGMVWAQEFHGRFPAVSVDECLGWFCNAIMRGWDSRGWRDEERASKAPAEAPDALSEDAIVALANYFDRDIDFVRAIAGSSAPAEAGSAPLTMLEQWAEDRPGYHVREAGSAPLVLPEPTDNEQLFKQGKLLARQFHDTYERFAPGFGYETRADTRHFDPSSANGRLMIAVCVELLQVGLIALATPLVLPEPPKQD